MQYALKVFETEDHFEFRVIDRDGEPWFVLADVCRAIDIKNASDAASRLDDDEKGVAQTDTLGGSQNVRVINESGLYSLVLRSDKPEAKKFKKWVTGTVLPQIRKTGSFNSKPQIPAFMLRQAENWDRVDVGYFSVINELASRLYTRLALAGHVMADKAPDGTENRPDVSVGRLFSTWLKRHHSEVDPGFTYYMHKTPQWAGEVRQYPMALLPLYIKFIDTVWIPDHFELYFRSRDAAALPYLQRLLPAPDRPKPGMVRGQSTMQTFRRRA